MSDEDTTTRQQNNVSGTQNNAAADQYNAARDQYVNSTIYIQTPIVAAPVATSPQLPYSNLRTFDLTNFVGRNEEMAWLRQRLAAQNPARYMVIVGIGGVGKTSLAVAVAEECYRNYSTLTAEERFEAFVWVSAKEKVLTIEGQAPADFPDAIVHTLNDIYTAIAQTLEREDITRAATAEQRKQLVQKALRNYRTLLIVDNIESITNKEMSEQVKTFLRTLPAPSKAIVTTRERTGWVDNVKKLERLSDADASQMIDNEATSQGVHLSAAQKQQLLELTYGLPLPIRLSVARLASDEHFAQVVRWLNDATGDLPEYCVKGQAVLVEERNPAAWKLLLACSLFDREAGASREALGQIADIDEAVRDDALTLLQRLFLLGRTEADRFWMLPIVQRYAVAQLAGAEFGEQVVERWLGWVVEFTQSFGKGFEFRVELTGAFKPEYPNLLAAVRWCRSHERWQDTLQLAETIWFYSYLATLIRDSREIIDDGTEAAKAMNEENAEMKFTRYSGVVEWAYREASSALMYLDKAEDMAYRLNDEEELGYIWDLRIKVLLNKYQLADAEQLVRKELEIGERLNIPALKFVAAQRFAEIELKKGFYDKALEWANKSERWSRESGQLRHLAWTLFLLGLVLTEQGDRLAAESYFMRSLALGSSWDERRLIARNEQGLAKIYAATSRLEQARESAKVAADIYERAGLTLRQQEVEDFIYQLQLADEVRTTESMEGATGAEGRA